ncbi:MAB_1171c family putative transporter [Kitasatospora misakiensis]|uniref:MAB_1171c family putative transporter n=1 Tax=Kitasatospora misakiensis TaxID=67330 RepID=A0ABW0X1E7_9ACTN
MRPFDLVVLPPVWLLTLFGLRRLRTVPRRNRLLWTIWAGWALSMTLGAPAVRRVVDSVLGVASVTNLPVHLLGLATTAGMLEFVREISGRARGRASRANLAGLAVASVALTVEFAVMPRPDGDVDLLTYSQNSSAGYLYWALLTAYSAMGMAASAWLCWIHARHALPGPARTSLLLMRASTLLGIVYLGHRFLYLTFHQLGWKGLEPAAVAGTTQILLAFTLVLFALAVVWPSLAEYRKRRSVGRQADRIAPLWRLLQTATPEVVLPLPEELRRNNPRLRLYRYVIEIRDSVLALEEYLDESRSAAAAARLTAAGVAGDLLAPAVEAVLLRYAVAVRSVGGPGECGGRSATQDLVDLEAEIHWFEQVAAAVELSVVAAVARELGGESPGASVVGAPGDGGAGSG